MCGLIFHNNLISEYLTQLLRSSNKCSTSLRDNLLQESAKVLKLVPGQLNLPT